MSCVKLGHALSKNTRNDPVSRFVPGLLGLSQHTSLSWMVALAFSICSDPLVPSIFDERVGMLNPDC